MFGWLVKKVFLKDTFLDVNDMTNKLELLLKKQKIRVINIQMCIQSTHFSVLFKPRDAIIIQDSSQG